MARRSGIVNRSQLDWLTRVPTFGLLGGKANHGRLLRGDCQSGGGGGEGPVYPVPRRRCPCSAPSWLSPLLPRSGAPPSRRGVGTPSCREEWFLLPLPKGRCR